MAMNYFQYFDQKILNYLAFVLLFFFSQHEEHPIAGYLSLHKSNESLLLKWTPNKLMSGSCEREKSQFWDYALTVNLNDVVYIHCHQHGKAVQDIHFV